MSMDEHDLTVHCAGGCGQTMEYDGTNGPRWCAACAEDLECTSCGDDADPLASLFLSEAAQ